MRSAPSPSQVARATCRKCAVGRARDNGLCLSCTLELKRRAGIEAAQRRILAGRPSR